MRSDSARREATRRDAARRDSVRRDSVHRDSAGRESARRDSIRRGTARRDSVKRDSIQRDSARRELAKRDTAKRTVAKRDSAKRDSVKRDATRRSEPSLPPDAARYTVQVAAYDTRAEADNLVSRLAARGFPARVVGDRSPPFRVRIGRYAPARLAEEAARALKEKGITSFVTTTDGESVPARTPNGTTPR
jgi:cell division protein FtsN